MSETKRKTSPAMNVFLAVCAVLCLGLLVYAVLFDSETDLYIGGIIFRSVRQKASACTSVIIALTTLVSWIPVLRDPADEAERKKGKRSVIALSAIFAVMLALTVYVISEDIVISKKAAIAVENLDGGKCIVLSENENHFRSSDDPYYEITLYKRDGIKLEKIGRLNEFNYTNSQMIKNGQYRVEDNGSSVTVYYDYGELANGLKWKDDLEEIPEYITKDYDL